MHNWLRLAMCAILSLLAGFGTIAGKTISLSWQPADSISEMGFAYVGNLSKLRVCVGAIQDMRTEKQEIGCNTELPNNRRRYQTKDDVALWTTGAVQYILRRFAVNVTNTEPDIFIAAQLIRFYVTESKSYKAEVVLELTAKDRTGHQIWSGFAQGKSNRWGRSFNEENFLESICNAILGSVYELLSDRSFILSFDSIEQEVELAGNQVTQIGINPPRSKALSSTREGKLPIGIRVYQGIAASVFVLSILGASIHSLLNQ